MYVKLLIFLCTVFIDPLALVAQQYNLIRRLPISTPADITHNPIGQFFILSEDGNIIKYSLEGEELARYYATTTEQISDIEAGSSFRLFAFYRESQAYQYFDRMLTPSPLYPLPQQDLGYVSQATPSADNSLWLWDASHLHLKKYKPALDQFLTDTPAQYYLDTAHQISQLHEYQNQVYVGDKHHEVMIFDRLGNYIQKLPVGTLERFDFYKDELYWQEGQVVYLYHVYNRQKRQINLPGTMSPLYVLLLEDRLLVFYLHELLIYRIL